MEMDKAVEAGLDAWFDGEDWRGDHPTMVPKWCAEMRAAITAADEARAVTNEEVVEAMITDWMAKAEPTAIPEGILKQYRTHRAIELVKALHAAGLKVIRG